MLKNEFGKFVRRKRLESGMTLNKFAISADIDPAIISRIENGKQDTKLSVLAKIAKSFNLTLSEFLAEFETKLHNS